MYGGGKETRIQIHSPTWLGRFGLFVLAFGDCPFNIVAIIVAELTVALYIGLQCM